MEHQIKRPEKIKLTEINPYLTCYLCKGYLIDATTISECLHSFCRSCIIKFLQDNSYCPVCEVIINKAKPNLKLDKTLQDIVYKLVPELFLREMTRRKLFYQQYPQILARVSPEERGEDTERTIFNPQDCISLSLEYISADSSPGAIKLPASCNIRFGSEKNGSLSPEENQALMKRYLQCPGMCRVEVLKKFVRNKYNVDTSLFHIDILYKRVPLPDHYTLIDIAYIYSWKRNEPMKFYFRITDINKVSERFDYFDSQTALDFVVKTPVRTTRSNGDRTTNGSSKKRDNKKTTKISNKSEDNNNSKSEENIEEETTTIPSVVKTSDRVNKCSDDGAKTVDAEEKKCRDSETKKATVNIKTNSKEVGAPVKPEETVKCAKENEQVNGKSELSASVLLQAQRQNDKGEVKKGVYTNITLNRTNNLEIITKIQKVSNKDGQAIGLNIIKQTVKNNAAAKKVTTTSAKKLQMKPDASKIIGKNGCNKKIEVPLRCVDENAGKLLKNDAPSSSNVAKREREDPSDSSINSEDLEKRKFLESIELRAKTVDSAPQRKMEPPQFSNGQKRKPTSPVKSEASKKPKMEKKATTRIILQQKPKQTNTNQASTLKSPLQNNGLKSLIEHCKIPSSLSITIKDGSENNRPPNLMPPVKNYIEILKLPDENSQTRDQVSNRAARVDNNKLDFSMKMCDNDSEQKVDEDLVQIAKSLTERIPMSTTISEIVGPKPQFPIPVKTNVPSVKFIQPSPVPEVPGKVLNVPKDNKLAPRSPQTFQKIFEESIKKPEDEASETDGGQKLALDLSNDAAGTPSNGKRNISDIATQLIKKTKLEQEKNLCDSDETPKPVPKVPIPRLPNQRNLKPPQKNSKFDVADTQKYQQQQTLTNLHSNALGLNYTISVGHNLPSLKVNGMVSPVKQDLLDVKTANIPVNTLGHVTTAFTSLKEAMSPRPSPIPRNLSPNLGCNSPRNSPKHSPKSSPMIKHMYAPMPNLMMDQLRVNTYSQRVNSVNKMSPKGSPQMPSSSTNLSSPNKHSSSSPKPPATSPKLPASSPKSLAPSPKPPAPSPKPLTISPKPLASSPVPPAPSSKPVISSPKPVALSPKPLAPSPKSSISSPKPLAPSPKPSLSSPKASLKSGASVSTSQSTSAAPSLGSPKASTGNSQTSSPLSPNQILEKYNIQNLAQLTASLNFNAAAGLGMNPSNQLAAIQHAMLLKHFEMQNRQNWLNMNQGPLLQYEKYLQSLKNNHLLSNIKEN